MSHELAIGILLGLVLGGGISIFVMIAVYIYVYKMRK